MTGLLAPSSNSKVIVAIYWAVFHENSMLKNGLIGASRFSCSVLKRLQRTVSGHSDLDRSLQFPSISFSQSVHPPGARNR